MAEALGVKQATAGGTGAVRSPASRACNRHAGIWNDRESRDRSELCSRAVRLFLFQFVRKMGLNPTITCLCYGCKDWKGQLHAGTTLSPQRKDESCYEIGAMADSSGMRSKPGFRWPSGKHRQWYYCCLTSRSWWSRSIESPSGDRPWDPGRIYARTRGFLP